MNPNARQCDDNIETEEINEAIFNDNAIDDDLEEEAQAEEESKTPEANDRIEFRSQTFALEGYSVRCHAHILSLVVTNSLKMLPEVGAILKKVRKIVGYYNQSTVATGRLRDAQLAQLAQLAQQKQSTTLLLDENKNP